MSILKHFPFLAQWGNTALLVATNSGNVSLVRMLLKESHSSLDEVNTVSVYICSNVQYYLVTPFEL